MPLMPAHEQRALSTVNPASSPADQRVIDAKPLYEQYLRQERRGWHHITDSRAEGRDYTEPI